MNTHPMIYDSVQSIVDGTQNFKEIIDNIFFSLKSLDAEEIAEYLIENWGRQRELSQKTRFTKIVCYIDFVRNK